MSNAYSTQLMAQVPPPEPRSGAIVIRDMLQQTVERISDLESRFRAQLELLLPQGNEELVPCGREADDPPMAPLFREYYGRITYINERLQTLEHLLDKIDI